MENKKYCRNGVERKAEWRQQQSGNRNEQTSIASIAHRRTCPPLSSTDAWAERSVDTILVVGTYIRLLSRAQKRYFIYGFILIANCKRHTENEKVGRPKWAIFCRAIAKKCCYPFSFVAFTSIDLGCEWADGRQLALQNTNTYFLSDVNYI